MDAARDAGHEDERAVVKNELLAALLAEIPTPVDVEHEVTAGMLAEQGIDPNMAMRILRKGLKEGKYMVRDAVRNGKACKAYRLAG